MRVSQLHAKKKHEQGRKGQFSAANRRGSGLQRCKHIRLLLFFCQLCIRVIAGATRCSRRTKRPPSPPRLRQPCKPPLPRARETRTTAAARPTPWRRSRMARLPLNWPAAGFERVALVSGPIAAVDALLGDFGLPFGAPLAPLVRRNALARHIGTTLV